MTRETMELYKKTGPTRSGCLPLLIQMPVFFWLFSTLSSSRRRAGRHRRCRTLTPELTLEFDNAKLFGIAPLHESLVDA